MRKIFIALLVISGLMAAPSAQAQSSGWDGAHNEISASYGVSLIGTTIGAVVNKANTLFGFLDGTDYVTVKNGGSKGIINLGYNYQFNKTVGVGLDGGFNRMSINLSDETGKLTAAAANVFTVMTTGKFNWFRKPVFGMYSKIGAGVMIVSGKLMEDQTLSKTLVLPTGHLSLVGMEVGRGFCGFLELGAGFEGIVQVGIRARF